MNDAKHRAIVTTRLRSEVFRIPIFSPERPERIVDYFRTMNAEPRRVERRRPQVAEAVSHSSNAAAAIAFEISAQVVLVQVVIDSQKYLAIVIDDQVAWQRTAVVSGGWLPRNNLG